MPGLVALPNAARTLFLPARPGGQPSRQGGRAFLALAGSVGPMRNGRKWRRKSLERLDSRPEMAPPLPLLPPAGEEPAPGPESYRIHTSRLFLEFRAVARVLLREAGKVARRAGWGAESRGDSMKARGGGRAIRPEVEAADHTPSGAIARRKTGVFRRPMAPPSPAELGKDRDRLFEMCECRRPGPGGGATPVPGLDPGIDPGGRMMALVLDAPTVARKWRRKSLERLDSRPEMAPPTSPSPACGRRWREAPDEGPRSRQADSRPKMASQVFGKARFAPGNGAPRPIDPQAGSLRSSLRGGQAPQARRVG